MLLYAAIIYTALACTVAMVFTILNFKATKAIKRQQADMKISVVPRDLQGLLRAEDYRTTRTR